MNKLREIFCPTPEQQQKQREQYKKLLENIEINNFKNVCDVSLNINVLQITYKKGENNLGELMEYLKNKKVTYNKIFSERPTLNDVFLELTGKELRD